MRAPLKVIQGLDIRWLSLYLSLDRLLEIFPYLVSSLKTRK